MVQQNTILVLAFRDFQRWYRGRMDYFVRALAKDFDVVIFNFPQKWVRENLTARDDSHILPSNVKIVNGYPIKMRNPAIAEIVNLIPNSLLLLRLCSKYKFKMIFVLGSLVLPNFEFLWNKQKIPMFMDLLDYFPSTFESLLTDSKFKKIGKSFVKLAMDRCIKKSRAITAASVALKQYGEQFKKEVQFIPNGIDFTSGIKIERAVLRKSLNISDYLVIGYLGVVAKSRRLDIMLKAFAKIRDSTKMRIVIVGEGPAMDYYKKLSFELDL